MTRTFFRWLSLLILVLALTSPVTAIAEEGQIYTIKKGDTLWDLSQRFIDDPYYWPNVWAKNPDITNPHLIFPGQTIRILDDRLEIIPAYAEGADEVPSIPEPTDAAPQATSEGLTIQVSGRGNGFILTDEQPLGVIADATDNRVLLTKNDLVFVKMTMGADARIGDTYGLFERGQQIIHPKTQEPIGTMMHNLGALQVVEISGETVTAKIIETFREIQRGAELFEYVPVKREIALQHATTDAPGFIIAGREEKDTLATNDVIFIDLGRQDGLDSGNLFYISRPRTVSKELLEKVGELQLPDEVLGAAVTIDIKDKTASAVIIKSVKEAFIGDQVEIVME